MTKEERKKAIDALKISAPIKAMTQEEFNDYIQTLNEVMDWLEQEPCDDAKPETVTEFADRCRECGAKYGKLLKQLKQEPCEDAISRQAVVDAIADTIVYGESLGYGLAEEIVSEIPPIKPQVKTGHWKDCGEREPWYRCSKCGEKTWGSCYKYCPHCGARMIKLQERNDEG